MGIEEIETARIKALEAEAEKHIAEKEKLVKEKDEIDKNLKKKFLDISLSSIIKTAVAGVVAGMLLWAVGLDYMFKINKVNVELKQQIVEENIKLQEEKKALKEELERTQRKLIALSDKAFSSTNEDSKEKFKASIVEEVHRLEDQSSKISVVQMPTQMAKPTSILNNKGWVYLGEYADGVWKTKYFDFPYSTKPKELESQKVSVEVHSINVRTKKFSGDVVKVLGKGQIITIDAVKNYLFTDYVWANVHY